MSKNINVNPDHYKVAGRERQGENILHGVEKRTLARLRRDEHQVAPPTKPGPRPAAKRKTTERPMASMPAARKVAGASGREPKRGGVVRAGGTGAMRRARPRAAKKAKKRS
jgi:hypothetical protein